MTFSRASIAVLTALLSACGVGEPLIQIEARGNEFRFRTGDGRAPTVTRININPVDAEWRAIDPVVCLLGYRVGSGGGPVGVWTYGTELPTLQIRKCGPLAPQSWYRIGVGGTGGGTALFSTDARGRITIRQTP